MTLLIMIWWSWYDFLLFLVRLNGSINKGMWKPGWPSVIGTHHLCTYMMHDLVQMNLLPLERLHCIFKHHWNNCRSLLHVGSTFSFGDDSPVPTTILLYISQVHLGPVKIMKYNHVFDSVISADAKGLIEYWSPDTLQFPENEYVLVHGFWFLIFYGKYIGYIFIFIYVYDIRTFYYVYILV